MINTDIHLSGGGYEADISSAHGGTCFRLLHTSTGADILRTPKNEAHRSENVYLFGNPALFPPNRIKGGRFEFAGREYVFPLNEPATGCHIHGAMWEQRFEIVAQSEAHVRLRYRAAQGKYIGFPHAFTFIRDYTLTENGLTEQTEITNDSSSVMPFMLAYHTTFNLPFLKNAHTEDIRVRLAVGREEMRTEQFIPTGGFRAPAAREKALQSGNYIPIGEHLSAFYECHDTMLLTDTRHNISILYEGMPSAFPYRMLFQPADGTLFVCEPQTCAIDCFHLNGSPEKYGLITVSPAETRVFQTRIAIQK